MCVARLLVGSQFSPINWGADVYQHSCWFRCLYVI